MSSNSESDTSIQIENSRDPTTLDKSRIEFTAKKGSGVSSGYSVVKRHASPGVKATSPRARNHSGRDPELEVHLTERSLLDTEDSDSEGDFVSEEEVSRAEKLQETDNNRSHGDQSAEILALKKQLAEAKASEKDLQLQLEASTIEKLILHKFSRGDQSTDKGSSARQKTSKVEFKKKHPEDLSSSNMAGTVKFDLSEVTAAINSMNNRMMFVENEIKGIRSEKSNQPRVGSMDSKGNASSHGVFGLRGQELSKEKHRLDQEVADGYVFNHVCFYPSVKYVSSLKIFIFCSATVYCILCWYSDSVP